MRPLLIAELYDIYLYIYLIYYVSSKQNVNLSSNVKCCIVYSIYSIFLIVYIKSDGPL